MQDNKKPVYSMFFTVFSIIVTIFAFQLQKGESENSWDNNSSVAKIHINSPEIIKTATNYVKKISSTKIKPKSHTKNASQIVSKKDHRVQLASFRSYKQAKILLNKIKKMGIKGMVLKNRRYYVVVSEKTDFSNAKKLKSQVDSEFKINSVIRG